MHPVSANIICQLKTLNEENTAQADTYIQYSDP